MRQLFPTYAEDVDLLSAYAYPLNRPWVRANMVTSADGAAVKDGSSRALSGAADQHVFGVLRGLCDVVLVGAGTARAENYRALRTKPTFGLLREKLGQRPAPVLAVVSHALELDPGSPLFSGEQRTIVITNEESDATQRSGLSAVADVVVAGARTVDLGVVVEALRQRGLPRVLCEGGPALLARVAAAGCLDELCLTVSPILVGGDARRVLDGPTLDRADMTLGHVLEEDGVLFTRYVVG